MRQLQPYYKDSHQAWNANIGPGKCPVRLATKDEGEKAAWDKYHALMSSRQPVKPDAPVAALLDRYLEHCHLNLAASTYKARKRTLESFARFIGTLRVSALKPHHVTRWINECHRLVHEPARRKAKETNGAAKETSSTYRHTLIRTVKTAFKWAEDEEYLDHSPVRKVKLPTLRSRDVYLLPDQWDKLVARAAKSRDKGCLLDIITVMKETGCRPQEARLVEARHFDRRPAHLRNRRHCPRR